MNPAENHSVCSEKIDASCRVPLLALFGGAALWLVIGLVLTTVASLTFHKPEMFAGCSFLTYGRVVPAANDLLVYGFAIPAALGVMLWIFARLSQSKLELPIIPVVAAHFWHVGVLVGTLAILTGNTSGYTWLEFPRAAAMLIGVGFVLIAISAVATFGQRKERELYPSHWFFLAALLWFPWIYATANLFLVSTCPVRGVTQAVINWWFANNLIYVWLALVGLGTAFYFLPKIAGRPLQSRFYSLFVFWTLILFGTWAGISGGAPVPAWLPSLSAFASMLLVVPLIAICTILVKTLGGAKVSSADVTYTYIRFGVVAFIFSSAMLITAACPQYSRILEFTWFGQAQVQLQVLGFFAMILIGAIYDILPRIMGADLSFKKFTKVQFILTILGVALFVIPLALAGAQQGHSTFAPGAGKFWLMISTTGLIFLLLSSLLLLANIFAMTIKWKLGLVKTVIAAVTAPLENSEAKS